MQIEVQKYPTPMKPRGFDFMAHNPDLQDFRAIYGFGATEEEAIADFKRQAEEDQADLIP